MNMTHLATGVGNCKSLTPPVCPEICFLRYLHEFLSVEDATHTIGKLRIAVFQRYKYRQNPIGYDRVNAPPQVELQPYN